MRLLAVLISSFSIVAFGDNASAAPVVAVLYFDNNTGDASLDVLKKGLADMMVTDLASVDQITVVERDRMEAILAELKLQKSSYFDKKTAVKIGKGLGAKYAVTGAIAAMAPEVRLDVRLIDIATSKVMVADRMTGRRDKFFELQRRLVEKFITGIDRKLRYRPSLGLKVPNVDTLMSYAEGVDLADQGQVDEARKRLKALVKRTPTFGLARKRIAELEANLNRAKSKRVDARSEAALELQRRTEAFLKAHPDITTLKKRQAEFHLGYRILKGAFIIRALRGVLSTAKPALVLPRNRKRARPLIDAYVANAQALIEALDAGNAKFPHLSARIDREAEQIAKKFGMDRSFSGEAVFADEHLAMFLLLGKANTLADKNGRFVFAPPPAATSQRYERVAMKLLKRARNSGSDYDRGRAAEALADYHELRRETELAVGALQSMLDEFPTHARFKFYENRIQELLGMKHDHWLGKIERYQSALDECDDMDFRIGVTAEISRRVRLGGVDAVEAVLDELIEKCKTAPKLESGWQYVFNHAQSIAADNELCPLYERMTRRFLEAKGHPSEAQRRQKKYAPKCKDITLSWPKPVCWIVDYEQLKPKRSAHWIRKALAASGRRTAPKGHWFNERDWFKFIHPRAQKAMWEKCRAVVRVDVTGTPKNAKAKVYVAAGPKVRPHTLSLGDLTGRKNDDPALDAAWKRVGWKVYPPRPR